MAGPPIIPVVLSGGAGTRLWPLSRRRRPKQLLALHGPQTMLQRTVLRPEGLPGLGEPLVVCNREHADPIRAQLAAIGRTAGALLLEPIGRNTAPAVALAALWVARHRTAEAEEDAPLLLVLPADQVVRDPAGFRAAVEQGIALARAGSLVTFGIVPDRPETGFGYIRAATAGVPSAVREFVEKPGPDDARRFVASGEYSWNSGMFLLPVDTYLGELRRLRPAIAAACERALASAQVRDDCVHVDAEAFAACPSESIDYAVMEHTRRAAVVPMDVGWSDVGSWDALYAITEHDEAGNASVGDTIAIDCEGTHLHATDRLVAAIGLRDAVVVETGDAVLVMPRACSQRVREVVARLDARDDDARGQGDAVRSWGTSRRLGGVPSPGVGWGLTVQAGQSTPLAPPPDGHDRHITVIDGRGQVQLAPDAETSDPSRTLHPGVTVCIPAGVRHRFVAEADAPLSMLALDLPRSTRRDS